MRTTVEFDADTARAVEALRLERGIGTSEAMNELIRRGLLAQPARPPLGQGTEPLGLSKFVSSVADAPEDIDSAATRQVPGHPPAQAPRRALRTGKTHGS